MTRKRRHRQVIVPMPPRGLRPKLDRGQLLDLSLVHISNLDAIQRGDGGAQALWDAVEAALLWSRVAELLGLGEEQMATQMHALESVIARYRRSGRVGFSGPEYQTAKDGVCVMDELARLVDQPTAIAAAAWSEARMQRIRAERVEACA